MRRRLFSLLYCCIAFYCMGQPDSLLNQLDGMLLNRYAYEQAKRADIEQHKANNSTATTLADRYNTLRSLYSAYRSYRIDSAMIVADERLKVARDMADPSKITSATLNLAEAYALSGAPDKAIALLDTLDTWSLENYHIKYRVGIYRTAYSAKAAAAVLPADRIAALEKLHYYSDEASKQSTPNSAGDYTLRAEKLRDAGLFKEAVAVMEEAGKKHDLAADAGMQYTLGEMYLSAGQREKAKESLARSAITDISNGVREYRALILLSSILFEDGDIERAFNYINCAFDDAEYSHAHLRTAEVMKCMPVIDAAFHEAQQQINYRTKRLLILAAILVLLLVLSLILVVKEFRTNRRMLATIADINAQLEHKNGELIKADSLKLNHINSLLRAYSGHISRFRDFRKNAYRLLKTSQFETAADLLKSDKAEQIDIAAFHEMFDEAFLSMFPDFVANIDRYMSKPVKIKMPGRLTPELRIAAMMRLGITSTDDIAGMLHYSSQTVYNLRSSLKGMVKVGWDEFEAYLRAS